eukprot:892533-Prorocentrum_lima.AAC.1
MIAGLIINELKEELYDEFAQWEDWNFELTIHFPFQFDANHLNPALKSAQKKMWQVKTQVEVRTEVQPPPDFAITEDEQGSQDFIHWSIIR